MLNIKTTSVLKTFSPALQSKFIPIPSLLQELKNKSNVMVLEIGKTPTTIFDHSIWAGNKAGGMSSWVASLLPHLPFDKFYLYIDENNLENKNSIEYLNQYFDKLFYKNYLGFCMGSRNDIDPKFLHQVSTLKAQEVPQKINSISNIALIDVRTREQIKKDPVENLPLDKENFKYINIPINDEDLGQTFYYRTQELSGKWDLITMCARGYRSMISYSAFRHFCQPNWTLSTCRSPYSEINMAIKKMNFKAQQ